MSLKTSSKTLLPPFIDVGTLRDMSDVASKIAVIRRYVLEVRRIEYKLLREDVGDKGFVLAMEEMAKFAKTCAEKSSEAIRVLEGIKSGIQSYLRRIQDATD